MKVSRIAAMGALYIRIHFLLLLIVAAVNAQPMLHAIQDTYQKLENSLIQNHFVLHQECKRHFSHLKTFLQIHFIYICMFTVGGVQPENCDNSFIPGDQGFFF